MSNLSLDTVLGVIGDIPERMCGHPQPFFLYELSYSLQGKGEIVEIGTCAGKSTIALAFGQKQKNGRKVYTIDIQEHPHFKANLARAQVDDWVIPIVNRSSLEAKKWRDPIELLWIDGDHRYKAIVTDIKSWSRFVIEGGYMALHDYPGLDLTKQAHKAVHNLVMSKPEEWRVVADRKAGSIIVFERMKNNEQLLAREDHLRLIAWSKVRNLGWYLEESIAHIRDGFS